MNQIETLTDEIYKFLRGEMQLDPKITIDTWENGAIEVCYAGRTIKITIGE